MKSCKLFIIFLCISTIASAQLYIDTPTTIHLPATWATNNYMDTFQGKLVFLTSDPVSGNEIRTYDGNSLATIETHSGSDNGVWILANRAGFATSINDTLYYSGMAQPQQLRRRIYKWDGVNTPTPMTDTNNKVYDEVEVITNLNGKLYFVAYAPGTSTESFFVYDPQYNTATKLSHPNGAISLSPYRIGTHNNKIYLSETGFGDLYEYDPATTNWKTIFSGLETKNLTSYGSKLYFLSGTNRSLLYCYDGTTVKNVAGSTDVYSARHPHMKDLVAYNGKIYFWGDTTTQTGYLNIYNFDTATQQVTKLSSVQALSYDPNTNDQHGLFLQYNGKIYAAAKDAMIRFDDNKADTMLPFYFVPFNMSVYKNELYMTGTIDSGNTFGIYQLNDTLVHGPVSIVNVNSFTGKVTMYPNPANDYIEFEMTLKQETNIRLQVLDMAGRTVLVQPSATCSKGTTRMSLALHNLTAGSYFIVLTDNSNGMLWSGKLIRQ